MAIVANMLSVRWKKTPPAPRASKTGAPTATDASAQYEKGSSYHGTLSGRAQMPIEAPKSTPVTTASAAACREERRRTPKASPLSTTRAPSSDQLRVRTSRDAGTSSSSCVTCGEGPVEARRGHTCALPEAGFGRRTATRRSIRLTLMSPTPSIQPSFFWMSATSDWQHMPCTCSAVRRRDRGCGKTRRRAVTTHPAEVWGGPLGPHTSPFPFQTRTSHLANLRHGHARTPCGRLGGAQAHLELRHGHGHGHGHGGATGACALLVAWIRRAGRRRRRRWRRWRRRRRRRRSRRWGFRQAARAVSGGRQTAPISAQISGRN